MPLVALSLTALLLNGAIFGFFYAWICSTMWGLDAADPRIAIQAMQAMNASVRNAVFAPAFFGTPFVLAAAGVLAVKAGQTLSGRLLLGAGVVYLVGGLVLTMLINVPMNEVLAATTVPADRAAAAEIWAAYSPRWQLFNILRTVASGVALLMTGLALIRLRS